MKRKVKRPFDNEQFRKGYVAGMFAAEKELNTELLHFAEKAHKIMSEGTFPDYGIKIDFKDSNNTITTNLDMKTEEKAKRYDEALNWMRELYPGLHGATKEDAEHYFPELKESEDERIRKEIVSALKFANDGGIYDKHIAYLEKQKEQKPITINQDEKEFLADEITAFLCNYDKEFDGEDPVPSEVAEHFYLLGKQAQEQKPSINIDQLKSLMLQYLQEAAKEKEDSDIEADTDKWARKILGYDFEQKPEWSEEDKKMLNLTIEWAEIMSDQFSFADIEPKDFRKIIAWLKSLKDRGNFTKSNTNSLSEWSKEDEKMLLSIINAFRNGAVSTIGQEQWLKLLPERFNLQPSLERLQKEKVYDIIAKLTNLSYSNLIPFNSEEYKKINEITSDVFDLLKYTVEKK